LAAISWQPQRRQQRSGSQLAAAAQPAIGGGWRINGVSGMWRLAWRRKRHRRQPGNGEAAIKRILYGGSYNPSSYQRPAVASQRRMFIHQPGAIGGQLYQPSAALYRRANVGWHLVA